jgi:predicted enzyme involved in methoxymalonyl-ACP biosynthesis
MLPDVPPTGLHVELPVDVVMMFNDGKIVHQHIYWDQASLLMRVGLEHPSRHWRTASKNTSRSFSAPEGTDQG